MSLVVAVVVVVGFVCDVVPGNVGVGCAVVSVSLWLIVKKFLMSRSGCPGALVVVSVSLDSLVGFLCFDLCCFFLLCGCCRWVRVGFLAKNLRMSPCLGFFKFLYSFCAVLKAGLVLVYQFSKFWVDSSSSTSSVFGKKLCLSM